MNQKEAKEIAMVPLCNLKERERNNRKIFKIFLFISLRRNLSSVRLLRKPRKFKMPHDFESSRNPE
jgi:hypothetical protein